MSELNKQLILGLVLWIVSISGVTAQFLISGQVVDRASENALPFANVFINQTTLGVAADDRGYFQLQAPEGAIELIISYVGYNTFALKLDIDKHIELGTISLEAAQDQLDEVIVEGKKDKDWEKNLVKFENTLFGSYGISKLCRIINPWVLNFENSDKDVIVTSTGPIKIRNEYLGYELWLYIQKSALSRIGYSIHANIYFTEIPSDESGNSYGFALNRLKAYRQSSRYLFKSIIEARSRGNGFHLYTDNPGGSRTNSYMESTNNFRRALGDVIINYDTLGMYSAEKPGLYKIAINGRMEIHNHNARSLIRTYEDVGYPVSWMIAKGGFIYVNENGIVLNPENLISSGDMIDSWLVRLLPRDYRPPLKQNISAITDEVESLREYVYVHTDKPYYHVGEIIWFKAYVNYFTHQLRDSLSRVLHIDFISPDRKVLLSKILPINDGFSFNDLALSDTLRSGVYFLRAYTNLQRNYGDSILYIKSIPVLSITEKIEKLPVVQSINKSSFLTIATTEAKYQTRDQIQLELITVGKEGRPVASHLSISVTDMNQVTPVAERSILEDYPSVDRFTSPKTLKFMMEEGISVRGYISSKRDRNDLSINMVDWVTREMFQFDAAPDGTFWITGLDFFGSRQFTLEAFNRKNKPYGEIELLPHSSPEIFITPQELPWSVIDTQNPQRISSSYEMHSGARLLDEVVIEDWKINIPEFRSTYGRPDLVLEQKDINLSYPNILYSLYKIVPEGMVLRTGGLSALNESPMMVTIDDVPVAGNPAEVLSLIDPSTVERVEITTRINVLYGTQGVNGVIAVYLKRGPTTAYEPESSASSFTIRGFDKYRGFSAPDYSLVKTNNDQADYRSTLYWNPAVVTDAETGQASVFFFAADLETTYRVVVEGVTVENEPIRGELLIEIENE